MVLTDKERKIVHVNSKWVELSGYRLLEVEGMVDTFMQGSMTDLAEVKRCTARNKAGK